MAHRRLPPAAADAALPFAAGDLHERGDYEDYAVTAVRDEPVSQLAASPTDAGIAVYDATLGAHAGAFNGAASPSVAAASVAALRTPAMHALAVTDAPSPWRAPHDADDAGVANHAGDEAARPALHRIPSTSSIHSAGSLLRDPSVSGDSASSSSSGSSSDLAFVLELEALPPLRPEDVPRLASGLPPAVGYRDYTPPNRSTREFVQRAAAAAAAAAASAAAASVAAAVGVPGAAPPATGVGVGDGAPRTAAATGYVVLGGHRPPPSARAAIGQYSFRRSPTGTAVTAAAAEAPMPAATAAPAAAAPAAASTPTRAPATATATALSLAPVPREDDRRAPATWTIRDPSTAWHARLREPRAAAAAEDEAAPAPAFTATAAAAPGRPRHPSPWELAVRATRGGWRTSVDATRRRARQADVHALACAHCMRELSQRGLCHGARGFSTDTPPGHARYVVDERCRAARLRTGRAPHALVGTPPAHRALAVSDDDDDDDDHDAVAGFADAEDVDDADDADDDDDGGGGGGGRYADPDDACACETKEFMCDGCGAVAGCHVVTPCDDCAKPPFEDHHWLFYPGAVLPERRMTPGGDEPLQWSALPDPSQDPALLRQRQDGYDRYCR